MAGNGDKPKRCRQLVQELMLCPAGQRQQSIESILNLVGDRGTKNNGKGGRDNGHHSLKRATELCRTRACRPNPV
mgnify:CR=1 FL=1